MPSLSKRKFYSLQKYILPVISIVVFLLLASLLTPLSVQASPQIQSTSTPTAQPTMTPDPRRLAEPVLAADNSEQLKKGAARYWGIFETSQRARTCHRRTELVFRDPKALRRMVGSMTARLPAIAVLAIDCAPFVGETL
ncbi:MAG TPA: hypothetical protein VHP14_09985, partial [Anaerolineales bacterium]|nr:hypothetical protein [Anaerolineales bacterium]